MNPKISFLPIVALINFILLGWWYLRVGDYLYIIGAIILANLIMAWWLDRSRHDWWNFAVLPILFSLSSLSYALIISQTNLVIALTIFVYLVLMVYWRLVFIYVFNNFLYKPFSLERLFYYLSFISVFFFTAAVFAIKTFIDIPSWQLLGVLLLWQIILVYQWAWVNKINFNLAWSYSLALVFMMFELFFVMTLLPLNFNISGFILASTWHGLSFLATENIEGRLSFKRSRLIIGLIFIVWLAVLITARWF